MNILIPLVLLILFLVFGMPIAFSLGISGAIGIMLNGGWDVLLGILQSTPYESVKKFLYSAIPMFILMASFMTVSGILKDLFYAAHKWLGRLPGGLAIATVFAGAGMGAASGSSTASAATMASASVPEMRKYKYNLSFSVGVASISGTLAVLIPPSIILILYGIMTEVGVGSLLIAGIIPGLLTALGYVITILIWVKLKPGIAPKMEEIPTFKDRFKSLKYVWPIMLIVIIVLGTIYTGIVTPTEAGAMGAFATFLMIIVMRRFSVSACFKALEDTLKSSTMILTIIIGAMIFGYFLTMTQVTQSLVMFINGLPISKYTVVIILVLIYLLLGIFMDQVAILTLTLPLTFPIIESLGFNPIWFGVVVTKTAEIGLVTPPVGMNVFVASGAANVKPTVAFRGVLWFVLMDLFILMILIIFPILSTWLPGTMLKQN